MNKAVLYDAKWQQLRVSCLKRHHGMGGFSTEEGTQDNLGRLYEYVWEPSPRHSQFWNGYTETQARIWRALNLCNATRMGFSGQGLRGSKQDINVREFRDTLQDHFDSHRVRQANDLWDWEPVYDDLVVLHRDWSYWFKAIESDLLRRADRASRKPQGLSHRTELQQFLYLMEKVKEEATWSERP